MSVRVAADAAGACVDAARVIGDALQAAIRARGRAALAASGGRTPLDVWRHLAELPLEWERVSILQVDERVAPEDHPDRNLGALRRAFAALPVDLLPMPIDGGAYTALPPVLDVVQLGLGADGHTASLFPDGPWPEADFGGVGVHLGRARFTLGLSCINRARNRVFVVTGADKAEALRRVLAGDLALPGARVRREQTVYCVDVHARGSE